MFRLFITQVQAAPPGLYVHGVQCVWRVYAQIHSLYSYIYIFITSVKLIIILHIHLAVIHTFSISVSSPNCLKLRFGYRRPQRYARGLQWAQYYKTALLLKRVRRNNWKQKENLFLFRRLPNKDISTQSERRGLGGVWTPPSPPLSVWFAPVGGGGMAFLDLYSYSVRANCTRTCNIQAGLKVCGTNTHTV